VTEVLRPVVTKSFLKATIVLAVFSVFLQINPRTILGYFGYVALFYLCVGVYAFEKHSRVYTIGEDNVEVRTLFRPTREIPYSEVADATVSQGFLAKEFGCGTVFLSLKHENGPVMMFGGGSAEALKDVAHPHQVSSDILNRIGMNGGSGWASPSDP
jgi:hypothetical protein